MVYNIGPHAHNISRCCAKYFGVRRYRSAYGLTFSIFILASGGAPFLFGCVYDVTGTYQLALYGAAIGFVAGAGLMLTLGRYPPA